MPARFAYVRSPYLVPFDGTFKVRHSPTAPPHRFRHKEDNGEALDDAIKQLRKLQGRLLASDRRALLVIFQALDAAGKDSTIKAVMSGVNPAGCDVHSFKRPSDEELNHDFLWRVANRLPERGRIGIFNRSHYEEVLVVKVHPELLVRQRLPTVLPAQTLWPERYESIRHFEEHLARNGTTIVKFFLNVSKREQKKRLLERIDDPEHNWKFEAGDIGERAKFPKYLAAYQEALNETSRPWAPWYAVPADSKRFLQRTVAEILVDTLRQLKLHYPLATDEDRRAMEAAKRALRHED